MKSQTRKEFLYFLMIFVPLSVLLFFVQEFVTGELSEKFDFYISTFHIYLFHAGVTFLIFCILLTVNRNSFSSTGYAFFACSLLKILASVVFLIPFFKLKGIYKIPDALAFFAPYFIYLILETYYALRLMKSNVENKTGLKNAGTESFQKNDG